MAASRLQLLQARFQQKQLQEKEQKLLQLYDQQQQRAHQVAQRGSAGSNASDQSAVSANVVVNASANKVKQLFNDDRRQQNGVKGIDKSYPLEPLKSKKPSAVNNKITKPTITTTNNNNNNNISNSNNNMTNRKLNSNVTAASTKRVIKADVNSNMSNQRENSNNSTSSRQQQQQQQQQQENFSSSLSPYVASSTNGSSSTSMTTTTTTRYNNSTEANGESIRQQQVNGHTTTTAKNGYHYEINIDDVIDNEALQRNRMLAKFQPGDIERRRRQLSADTDNEFPTDDYSYNDSAVTVSRKSSLKNAKSNTAIHTTAGANVKKTIPRKSTVMKTTTSSSLKVCNPPKNHNRLVLRRKSSLIRKTKTKPAKEKKKIIEETPIETTVERCCEISERCFPPPWNTLKSTSLICEIIRKHSKLQQMRSKSKVGRVKSIVTKIENQTITVKPTTSNNNKFVPVTKSIEKRLLEMTRDVEPTTIITQEPLDLLNANFVEALKAAESNETVAKNEDDEIDNSIIETTQNEVQETKVEQRLPNDEINRVRRASFEQKRAMFEQLLQRHYRRVSRHNSVESALRLFDDERHEDATRKNSISSDNGQQCVQRGFERSTSAWTIRTANRRRKKSHGKKILEARDSIELTKVPVFMTNMPACKKKIIQQHSRKISCDNHDVVDDEDVSRSRKSSFQMRDNDDDEGITENKNDCYVVSKAEVNLKKNDSIGKVNDAMVKNVMPYPSSKSPDNNEPKSRSVVKSTSLKLLSRFSGDVPNTDTDQRLPIAPRKSSIIDNNDEKLPTSSSRGAPVIPAPRTPNTSVATTRNPGSRPNTKAKTPTPAARTTAPSYAADDSLVTCKICTRRFQSDRITKHEQICAKTTQKKRRQFDVVGHRVKGTELESFVQKPNKKQSKAAAAAAAASTAASNSSKTEAQKSNWRRKHEDFINAIRSAKLMQAHLASGGKLSDLPPPPPSDNSDYVQCPHCSRKFNAGAAERHIPKCETMQHNKPKPRAKR